MTGLNEPVHWRAVLDPAQVPQQLNSALHVVGFRDRRSAESWIASELDFKGWRYELQPLYLAPNVAAECARIAEQAGGLDATLAAQAIRDAFNLKE